MKNILVLMVSGVVGVMALSAQAADNSINSFDRLPNSGNVSLDAVVESLDGQGYATLRDANGRNVRVQLSDSDYQRLRVGQRMMVNGSINTTSGGSQVNANSVSPLSNDTTLDGNTNNTSTRSTTRGGYVNDNARDSYTTNRSGRGSNSYNATGRNPQTSPSNAGSTDNNGSTTRSR